MMKKNKRAAGFTLIELLIVIAILGILATIIFSLTSSARVQAKDTKRIEDLRQVQLALELYYYDNGSYPTMHDNSNLAQNWSDLLNTLEAGKYLTRAEDVLGKPSLTETVVDKIYSFMDLLPKVFASSLNTVVQDPLYPTQTYAYMPSAIPRYTSYRIRAKLENNGNQILTSAISGKFLYSDEDPVSYPDNPDTECAPASGYYCVGPLGSFTAFDPGKPVVYLYPEKTEQVSVSISPKSITYSLPNYGKGWSVTAHPDGQIYDSNTQATYPYLYWEGDSNKPRLDPSSGAVVPTQNVESYLRQALKEQGLKDSEIQDFVDYWVPRLTTSDPYVYVYFMPRTDYDALIPMTITPKPDTLIRVYMFWKPLTQMMNVTPQHFSAPARTGFTAVEWGGNRSPLK